MALDPKKQQKATTFLQGVLQHVPDAQRGQAAELFQSLGNVEQAAEYVAGHILRQEDYSRAMNEGKSALETKQQELDGLLSTLNTTRDAQEAWWKTHKDAMADYERLRRARPDPDPDNADPDDPPNPKTPSGLTREDLDRILNERESTYVNVMEAYTSLSHEHVNTFKEPLTQADFERIRKHPQIGELGLVGAWKATFKDKFDARAADARKAEEEKWKQAGRDEALEEYTKRSGPPYSVPGSQPTPLDVLLQPEATLDEARKAASPESLAAEYLKKVSETSPDDAGWVG